MAIKHTRTTDCQRCGEPFEAKRRDTQYCPKHRQSEKAWQKALRKITRLLSFYRYQFDRDWKRVCAISKAQQFYAARLRLGNPPDIAEGQAASVAYWGKLAAAEAAANAGIEGYGVVHNTMSIDVQEAPAGRVFRTTPTDALMEGPDRRGDLGTDDELVPATIENAGVKGRGGYAERRWDKRAQGQGIDVDANDESPKGYDTYTGGHYGSLKSWWKR